RPPSGGRRYVRGHPVANRGEAPDGPRVEPAPTVFHKVYRRLQGTFTGEQYWSVGVSRITLTEAPRRGGETPRRAGSRAPAQAAGRRAGRVRPRPGGRGPPDGSSTPPARHR